jgi:flagellar biosynthesis protein FliR
VLVSPEYLVSVFLVFVRIGALFSAAPFFGHRSVPVQIRILLAVVMAHALTSLVPAGSVGPDVLNPVGLIVAVIVEALTGALLGFAVQLIFWIVTYAGEVMGFQIGLSMAQVFNPIDGTQSNPIGNILSMTFLIVFLLLDGHHQVLRAFMASFEIVPLAGARLSAGGPVLLTFMGEFFTTALRLAAPFMVTIFLVDVALGVFARMVPQADLFSLGLPVKILAGSLLLLLYMSQFFPIIPNLLDMIVQLLERLMAALGSG